MGTKKGLAGATAASQTWRGQRRDLQVYSEFAFLSLNAIESMLCCGSRDGSGGKAQELQRAAALHFLSSGNSSSLRAKGSKAY